MSARASTSATTLRGLSIVRLTRAVIAISALGLFVASIPAYVSNVKDYAVHDGGSAGLSRSRVGDASDVLAGASLAVRSDS
jgi:hypothetical protein